MASSRSSKDGADELTASERFHSLWPLYRISSFMAKVRSQEAAAETAADAAEETGQEESQAAA